MRQSRIVSRCLTCLCLAALSQACEGSDAKDDAVQADAGPKVIAEPCVPDASAPVPSDRCAAESGGDPSVPLCGDWSKVEPDGAVCSDGSQYKFFVNYSNTSNNLLVMFEPGGACWDYASCSGGARGAANPTGIADDHMSKYQYLNLLRRTDDNPAKDWNFVFVSYCTGDVHIGDKVATYADPAGGDPLMYRHAGHADTQQVITWLQAHFSSVPQLLVTGCSAGGIGALENYSSVRSGLTGAQCGYLLDDSGPSYHGNGPSKPLQDKIRSAWNLDPMLNAMAKDLGLAAGAFQKDPAVLNTALADKYPHDRLSLSAYRMDFNFSLYSYESFYPKSTEAQIHALWWQDLQALLKTYDTRDNLAYYVPYFREDNCSHCVSIPPIGHDTATVLNQPWLGSEIESDHVSLRDFVVTLLDDTQPLVSYLEPPRSAAMFTSDESMMCLEAK